jgi:hypothetical protein
MWCDSSTEAYEFLNAHGDKDQWREVPPEQRPSLAKYWREHSVAQILRRIWHGSVELAVQNARAIGYYKFVVTLLIAALIFCLRQRREARELVVRNAFAAIFCLAFFAAYFVLYAWYDTIINDTRFVLSIFLPFVFVASAFILRLGRDRGVSFAGWQLPFEQFLGVVLLGLSVVDVLYNAPSLLR